MLNHPVIVGILSGIASALLFLAAASGTALAVPLMLFCPLPLMLAGLGWQGRANLIAIAAFAGSIALLSFAKIALLATLVIALPSLTCAFLYCLSRPAEEIGGPAGQIAWFPINITFTRGLLIFSAGFVISGIIAGFFVSDFEAMIGKGLEEFIAGTPQPAGTEPISQEQLDTLAQRLTRWLPVSISATWVCILAGNFALAERITRDSGKLDRPRPEWSLNTNLQPLAVMIFIIACGLLFSQDTNSALGTAAGAFVGTFGAGFMLIGLAVLHYLTLGSFARAFILTCAYLFLIIIVLPAVLFALLGIAETFIGLRKSRRLEPHS